MTYSKEQMEKLVASNKEAVAEWEKGADLPRLRQLANEMKLISSNADSSTIRVRVAQPLVDGMPRLRAMYRSGSWPTTSKVKSEYHRRRRNR